MARAGEVDPPRELRPLLRFAKLPPRGAAVIRRVLETDADFRAAVAEAADNLDGDGEGDGHGDGHGDGLGRPSWLFLHRPDGWEEEFESLLAAVAPATAAAAADEARVLRKLAGAEERIARLEADAAAAREELAAVRRARQAAGRRVQAAEAERDALQAEVARLEAALAAVDSRPPPVPAPPPLAPPPPPPPPVPEPAPDIDIAGLRSALTDALALLPDDSEREPDTRPPATARPRRAPSKPARRRPVGLPPGLRDDSPEAADHLVRTKGAVVLVDGYNATISAWPDLPLADQRSRLVDALAELVARTGADATVVFDGAHEPTRTSRPVRSPVRVLFSPPDVPADDVILDLVDGAPPRRPVIVASDDRAVQDGAARRGANVMTRAQLLATLRRGAR